MQPSLALGAAAWRTISIFNKSAIFTLIGHSSINQKHIGTINSPFESPCFSEHFIRWSKLVSRGLVPLLITNVTRSLPASFSFFVYFGRLPIISAAYVNFDSILWIWRCYLIGMKKKFLKIAPGTTSFGQNLQAVREYKRGKVGCGYGSSCTIAIANAFVNRP
jgi:hypothetical protein